MKTQNLIKQTLSQPESVVVIQQILEDNKEAPRSGIAQRVCQHFEFFNALGKPQKAVALRRFGNWSGSGDFNCLNPEGPPRNRDPNGVQRQ